MWLVGCGRDGGFGRGGDEGGFLEGGLEWLGGGGLGRCEGLRRGRGRGQRFGERARICGEGHRLLGG